MKQLICLAFTVALLTACNLIQSEPAPITVTEIVTFDDGLVVEITRVITPEPTATIVSFEPTIPVPTPVVALDVGVIGSFGPPDPQQAIQQNTLDLVENLYVGLTQFDVDQNIIKPELARSWIVSGDGLRWTFTLRDDVQWVRTVEPSGLSFLGTSTVQITDVTAVRPVNASDVVAAVQRACAPTTSQPDQFLLFIIDGCEAVNVYGADVSTVAVQALGAQIVEFRLREPAAWFPSLTAHTLFYPIPADTPDWLTAEGAFMTSGAFTLNPFGEEDDLAPVTRLQANPYYPTSTDDRSLPTQRLDLVNLYQFGDRSTAYGAWRDSLVDVIPLPNAVAGQFLGASLRPPLNTSTELFYLGFNMNKEPFNTAEVRRAFSSAIDRERLVEEVYGSEGRPIHHLVPPGALHALPIEQVALQPDPAYALDQLVRSGFRSCPFLGNIDYMITESDRALQHAELLVDMWVQTLGCQTTQFQIEQVPLGTLLMNTRPDSPNSPHLFDLAWASFYPDAHNWFMPVLHCQQSDNRAGRPCEQADAVLSEAAVNPNRLVRKELYEQVETLFFGEEGNHPIAPLFVLGEYQLTQDWVTRWQVPHLGGVPYNQWRVNQELKNLERSQ